MAWSDEMVAIVRGLIQDYSNDATGTVETYSDDTLSTLILIGGYQTLQRIQWPVQYAISVSNETLSPDPTMKVTRDDPFINLSTLKASCILVNAEIKQYASQSISIRDGTSAISLQRPAQVLSLMQKSYCSEYDEAIYRYITSLVTDNLGEAIVGPVKAWYWGGGYPEQPYYGSYQGPGRIGHGGGGGGDWYDGNLSGYGQGFGNATGGNWGFD